jgi:CheY-like chemotaxis protein
MAQSLYADDMPPGQHTKVGIILDSGSILMALLNDVLDISKINAGKLEIAPIDGDLRVSLMGIVHLFRQGADDKGVALNVVLDPAIPSRLKFDPVRVQQCISNLLSNAIKFTPQNGKIDLHVTCAMEPSGIVVTATTTDTGIGMSPETVAKLFSVFTQADGSISRRFGGSGLGLVIARRLAQAMGGDIDVTSQLGVGSCFRMKFTAAAAPLLPVAKPAARDIAPPTTAALSGARVLLVDDNAVNRQVVTLFLKPFNLDIAEAANGKEALEKLASGDFDIVLLDVHMPVMDGCETIKAIRASTEAWSSVPTIALTADAMNGDKERYLTLGMTDYLTKPIDQRELLSKVTSIIAAQRADEAADSKDLASWFDGPVWRSAG